MVTNLLIKSSQEVLRARLDKKQEKLKRKRRFERHSIFVIGMATILDRAINIDGIVEEISKGGIRFRPAKNYILDRTGETIQVSFDEYKLSGTIRATLPKGYGIALFDMLDDEALAEIVETYK